MNWKKKENGLRGRRGTTSGSRRLTASAVCLAGMHWTRLQAIEAECQDERDTVRQWIDSVCDSMTRRALRLRYLDGKSWSECARRMGYADESGPRKLVGKLWSK